MRIKVKLFASLAGRLPPGSEDNTMELEVPEGATPRQVVEQLDIPPALAGLTLVNGEHLIPAAFERRHLQEGQTLSIFPPIAGGSTRRCTAPARA